MLLGHLVKGRGREVLGKMERREKHCLAYKQSIMCIPFWRVYTQYKPKSYPLQQNWLLFYFESIFAGEGMCCKHVRTNYFLALATPNTVSSLMLMGEGCYLISQCHQSTAWMPPKQMSEVTTCPSPEPEAQAKCRNDCWFLQRQFLIPPPQQTASYAMLIRVTTLLNPLISLDLDGYNST